LFAAFAGISALLNAEKDELRPADLAFAVAFLGLISLPISPLSWVAVTGLSSYIFLFAKGSCERIRGALILLALSVPMLWSRLVFQFFANPILEVDAALAAWWLGTDRFGNLFRFADGSGYVLVAPACSSLANTSLAFLCWTSITLWAKHQWSAIDIL